MIAQVQSSDAWTIASAVGTVIQAIAAVIVAAVAIWAYSTARKQLEASKIDRTVALIRLASCEDMEFTFGFFDVSADLRASRAACTALFNRLVQSRPIALREVGEEVTQEAVQVAIDEMLNELDNTIIDHPTEPTDRRRELAFRNKLFTLTNFCETAWVQAQTGSSDLDMFLADQDYNVASSYYVLENVLQYLVREEHFDFEDFRSIALAAQRHHCRRPNPSDAIAEARFRPLSDD
jgi:hypothetical protein